jgi:hypothetical protein
MVQARNLKFSADLIAMFRIRYNEAIRVLARASQPATYTTSAHSQLRELGRNLIKSSETTLSRITPVKIAGEVNLAKCHISEIRVQANKVE